MLPFDILPDGLCLHDQIDFLNFGGFVEASMEETCKDGCHGAMDSLKVHDR